MAKLVAFYSRADENYFGGSMKYIQIGNTEKAAKMIADMTGADLFKIEQKIPYAADYNTCIAQAKEDKQTGKRPEILNLPQDIDQYDEIYLGYPNYWGTMPMAVYTFLESYDFTGKKIHPFCTHEGSGLSNTESDIKKSAKGAVIEKGIAIHGSGVDQENAIQKLAAGQNHLELVKKEKRVLEEKSRLEAFGREMDTEIEVRKMECKEIRVDVRTASIKESTEGQRQTKILFQINHTMPFTDEYNHLLKELFGNNLGDGSMISPPLNGACVGSVKIGRNVFINSNLLAMARGGITIEDNAMIAANVQLISNNHDPYDLCTLTCKPVLIREYAWVGAGATILPGVCIGRHAIVGAGSVVTKDVPDYAVAVGNPAKVIKMLDKEKFQED